MLSFTKEDKEFFKDKLDYIGLDLDNIPEFLNDFNPLEFRPNARFDNKEYMVYRFVPMKDIQILITNTNRLTDIKEKYEKAKPIKEYLKTESEEHIEGFAKFLNMLKNTEICDIQEAEAKQKELNNSIPFEVKYEKNYVWQIYYSEYSDQYFMLVPADDVDFGALFYLLKEQINNSNEYIYVPIANYEPEEDILKRNERIDLENYLWLFTKAWPNIYEVTQKDGVKKIIIVGETEVYNSIFAKYHIELNNREEASEFYKQLKALFILQTELQEYYKFDVQIDEDGKLEFYYKDDKIDYKQLGEFITKEFIATKNNIKKMQKSKKNLFLKLDELKEEAKQKEAEFLEKQREISTYLQYKRTFFGKVRYFFSRKKKYKKSDVIVEGTVIGPEKEIFYEEKSSYNIEDLVTIYATYSKLEEEIKNKKLDEEALELKIKNLDKKIENATLYIKEIDSHKKSIFEFWKFSSKDDAMALNPGEEEENTNENKSLRKVFEYDTDRDDIANQIDKNQREKLSKEEEDIIFVANSVILPILNKIKSMIKVPDDKVNELLERLKEEAKEDKKTNVIEYDIFGGLSEDRTKIKVLGKNKHRETEKNLYQILNINDETTLQDFKATLKKIEKILSLSFTKVQNVIDMPIYKTIPNEEKVDIYGFNKYSMSPEIELMNTTIEDDEINLIKVNLKEKMPAVFYTNIMFFDNFNKTLPLGMDKTDDVLIDAFCFDFTLKNKKTIYTNKYFTKEIDSNKLNTKKVNIFEYDIELKRSEVKSDK